MKKKMLIAFMVCLVMTTNLLAGGYYQEKDPEVDEEKAIEELSSYNEMSIDELAEVQSITIDEFRRFIKTTKFDSVEITPTLLRSPVCPRCKNGRFIHLGNKYTPWQKNRHQKMCNHHAYGIDYEEERTCTATRRCESCFYEATSKWSEIQEWCVGTENPEYPARPHKH